MAGFINSSEAFRSSSAAFRRKQSFRFVTPVGRDLKVAKRFVEAELPVYLLIASF